MPVRFDRIKKVQENMREQGIVGCMVMNHDDYQYLFGRDWAQPRAIIPWSGPPLIIAFAAEEPEIRRYIGAGDVKIFSHVGEQINDVVTKFREIVMQIGLPPGVDKPKVCMQMWFDTPAFLVDLFRKVNFQVDLVSSDPVMDPLRQIKEPEEIELMTEAQRIAGLGMDRARRMLKVGVTSQEIATEVLHTMMKASTQKTSTPLYINIGTDSCMLHGRLSEHPLKKGDLIVIDLTPQVAGYCANLTRTFVLGAPDPEQQRLLETYSEMIEKTRAVMKPGTKIAELDKIGKQVCEANGLGAYHVDGISHGIGLRFEETPATTIIKQHRSVEIRAGMTLTIGHTILALPGKGGVRHEDIYQVTPDGGKILNDYPIDPIITA